MRVCLRVLPSTRRRRPKKSVRVSKDRERERQGKDLERIDRKRETNNDDVDDEKEEKEELTNTVNHHLSVHMFEHRENRIR